MGAISFQQCIGNLLADGFDLLAANCSVRAAVGQGKGEVLAENILEFNFGNGARLFPDSFEDLAGVGFLGQGKCHVLYYRR